jgi:hypothetical protein
VTDKKKAGLSLPVMERVAAETTAKAVQHKGVELSYFASRMSEIPSDESGTLLMLLTCTTDRKFAELLRVTAAIGIAHIMCDMKRQGCVSDDDQFDVAKLQELAKANQDKPIDTFEDLTKGEGE